MEKMTIWSEVDCTIKPEISEKNLSPTCFPPQTTPRRGVDIPELKGERSKHLAI